jgi:UDP-3-O-[3-hydroxymyristoyl] N-acetylglucosamine deacetylase
MTAERTEHRSAYTLAGEFTLSGVGLHSGEITTVTVKPEWTTPGRVFVRRDRPNGPTIPARVEAVSQTTLSTELKADGAEVRTVEHLLASLVGMGIDRARIEIDGPEVPLLDGSAQPWVEAIARVGRVAVPEAIVQPVVLDEPIVLRDGDAFVAAFPDEGVRISYGIDFPYAAIGNQWYSWSPDPGQIEPSDFARAIAPARTFGFADQIEALRNAGLIKGGSLDNALVCSADGWLNGPLRFANEPVRHKILDLVGDLSLLGVLPQAHLVAYKASHKLHVRLARAIAESGSSRNCSTPTQSTAQLT